MKTGKILFIVLSMMSLNAFASSYKDEIELQNINESDIYQSEIPIVATAEGDDEGIDITLEKGENISVTVAGPSGTVYEDYVQNCSPAYMYVDLSGEEAGLYTISIENMEGDELRGEFYKNN